MVGSPNLGLFLRLDFTCLFFFIESQVICSFFIENIILPILLKIIAYYFKAPIGDSCTIHRHSQLSNIQFYCETSTGNFTQSEMESSELSAVSEPPELDDSC